MKVKGHALVWHNQLPSWVSSLTNATEVRAAMVAHIKEVVRHYKGKVQAWDVVNEAVSLDGKGMRDSVFYKYLGETFIDEAFQAARDTDPDVKLYYNDYNCEGLTLKANKVFELVKGMKSHNVPFDGVGLQMHYGEPNEATPTADFVANLKRYADLGLDLLISEMDVRLRGPLVDPAADRVPRPHRRLCGPASLHRRDLPGNRRQVRLAQRRA